MYLTYTHECLDKTSSHLPNLTRNYEFESSFINSKGFKKFEGYIYYQICFNLDNI